MEQFLPVSHRKPTAPCPASLPKADCDQDPIQQFGKWFKDACECSEIIEPTAMGLSTASRHGRPSLRTVLMKRFDKEGFLFFTNIESHKGRDLAENPYGALLFYWPAIYKQVRIEGRVIRCPDETVTAHFNSQPSRDRQIGYAAQKSFHQSQPIASREDCLKHMEEVKQKYEDNEELKVELPKEWGGFILQPDLIEFWQEGADRLNDRIEYRLSDSHVWSKQRLQP